MKKLLVKFIYFQYFHLLYFFLIKLLIENKFESLVWIESALMI